MSGVSEEVGGRSLVEVVVVVDVAVMMVVNEGSVVGEEIAGGCLLLVFMVVDVAAMMVVVVMVVDVWWRLHVWW